MIDLKAIKTTIIAFVLITPMSVPAGEEQADKVKEVPSEYRTMKNPFSGSDKAVFERGEYLFSNTCRSCHGEKGDGVGGKLEGYALPIFNKEFYSKRTDGYLFWRVEQGVPDTPMRPFGPGSDINLSADDIWKIIAFERERFGK